MARLSEILLILVIAMVGLATVAEILYGSLLSLPFFLRMEVHTGLQWTLAGMSASRNCFQDTLDEQRRLSDSLFLYDWNPHMAMEPRRTSHKHIIVQP